MLDICPGCRESVLLIKFSNMSLAHITEVSVTSDCQSVSLTVISGISNIIFPSVAAKATEIRKVNLFQANVRT